MDGSLTLKILALSLAQYLTHTSKNVRLTHRLWFLAKEFLMELSSNPFFNLNIKVVHVTFLKEVQYFLTSFGKYF